MVTKGQSSSIQWGLLFLPDKTWLLRMGTKASREDTVGENSATYLFLLVFTLWSSLPSSELEPSLLSAERNITLTQLKGQPRCSGRQQAAEALKPAHLKTDWISLRHLHSLHEFALFDAYSSLMRCTLEKIPDC